MKPMHSLLLLVALCAWAGNAAAVPAGCPNHPGPATEVPDAPALHSAGGELHLGLTVNSVAETGYTRYCYMNHKLEAPTLRLAPGERLEIDLTNNITTGAAHADMKHDHAPAIVPDPCAGVMTDTSTNIHFHGLNVPPTCHQDEVVHTLINAGDPTFKYRLRVPPNEPPGLYWYHPHPHGMTMTQVMGGLSGALIVEGIESLKPEVAGLTERVLIFRDQLIANSPDKDASNITINFEPSTYPQTLAPTITLNPGEKQFWRVLNAMGEKFLNLQVLIDGSPEVLEVVARDGVPLAVNENVQTVLIPPAGRAEFIMQGPPAGVDANLATLGINSGKDGDPNPAQKLADIHTSAAARRVAKAAPKVKLEGPRRFADLAALPVRTQRKLYFSEDLTHPKHPLFYLTVDGQARKLFDPDDPPAIVTEQGAVEDWTVENRSREIHAFHMHQIHFLVLQQNGKPVADQEIVDTVTVKPWNGISATYPSVKLRMDFRYGQSVGTFVYHCHILDHEDGGMMAKIQVNPKP